MLDFLTMLFFTKVMLLTPAEIDLSAGTVIHIDPPVSAATNSAYVQIDVGRMISSMT